MSETTKASGGVGFFGLLTLLFIGLKLTGFISWSWLWVLSPILIPLVFGLALTAVVVIGGLLMYFLFEARL